MLIQWLLSNVIKVKRLDINNITHTNIPLRNSISRYRPKTVYKEISDIEKAIIIAFFHILEKRLVVTTRVHRSQFTIRKFYAQTCDRGQIANAPHFERSVILSQQDHRTIVLVTIRDQGMTGWNSRISIPFMILSTLLTAFPIKPTLINSLHKPGPI